MGGIVKALAIELNGDGDPGGESPDNFLNMPEGVGTCVGMRECTVADKSIAAANGEVIGRKWGWYIRPAIRQSVDV